MVQSSTWCRKKGDQFEAFGAQKRILKVNFAICTLNLPYEGMVARDVSITAQMNWHSIIRCNRWNNCTIFNNNNSSAYVCRKSIGFILNDIELLIALFRW